MDQAKVGKFIAAGVAVSVKLSFDELWVLISPFWLIVFCWLRNRMMAYVEGKVYGDPKPPTDG